MADASDPTLLRQVARGERDALAMLYDRHAPALFGLALTILTNRSDAEDLVHDVFLEAWQKANTYDPERATVRHWLTLRTRSRAIDRLRARKAAGSAADTLAAGSDDGAYMSTDAPRLPELLNQLTRAQREVIELSFFSGLNCNEIAAHINAPPSTIRSRLAAALGQLRQRLYDADTA